MGRDADAGRATPAVAGVARTRERPATCACSWPSRWATRPGRRSGTSSMRLRADTRIPGAARLRWAISDNLHLTMRFLGATPPDRVADVVAAAKAATTGLPPSRSAWRGRARFPRRSRPRVVWLGIERGAPGSRSSRRALARASKGAACWPTSACSWPTSPSAGATVSPARPQPWRRWKATALDLEAAWTADRLVVYRSVLGHGPPQYEPLATAPLAAGGLPGRPSLE